jgi:hypothetical protein
MNKCASCRFFDRAKDFQGKLNDYGRCKKNPPKFLVLRERDGSYIDDPCSGHWPEIAISELACGAYE